MPISTEQHLQHVNSPSTFTKLTNSMSRHHPYTNLDMGMTGSPAADYLSSGDDSQLGIYGQTPGRGSSMKSKAKRNEYSDFDSAEPDTEDARRRKLRRDRNREAAARCRQRRLDLIQDLEGKVADLKDDNATLEMELQKVRAERDQMRARLSKHEVVCSYTDSINCSVPNINVKTESCTFQSPPSSNDSSTLAMEQKASSSQHRPNTLQMNTPNGFKLDPALTGLLASSGTGLTPSSGLTPLFTSNAMLSGMVLDTPTTTVNSFLQL